MTNWEVYYDDGSVRTPEDGAPQDLPIDGVQLIVETNGDGTRTLHQGCDYYAWIGDNWASGSQKDLDRWLRVRPPQPLIVLFGRWTTAAMYRQIVHRASERRDKGCAC